MPHTDDFRKKHLNGTIAEAFAEAHFAAMGDDVDQTGIEFIAPKLTRNREATSQQLCTYMARDKKLFSIPDRIISRVDENGRTQGTFVEVKFLSTKGESDQKGYIHSAVMSYVEAYEKIIGPRAEETFG